MERSCVQIRTLSPVSFHQPHQHWARSVLSREPEREAPKVDAPLPYPLQSLIIATLSALILVAVEGESLHALVGLNLVRHGSRLVITVSRRPISCTAR